MLVASIMPYNSGCYVSYKRMEIPKTVNKSGIIDSAKNELEQISKESHIAGSKSAWWRNGYSEAVESLKKIAAGEGYKEAENPVNDDGSLNLSFFHSTDDGLI